jgi:hypothetical protein
MITYEEALKKAKALKTNINYCIEYEDAYTFSCENEQENNGGDSPVVVLKDTGRAISMIAYATQRSRTAELRAFEVFD